MRAWRLQGKQEVKQKILVCPPASEMPAIFLPQNCYLPPKPDRDRKNKSRIHMARII
jgi:hypothetical protein